MERPRTPSRQRVAPRAAKGPEPGAGVVADGGAGCSKVRKAATRAAVRAAAAARRSGVWAHQAAVAGSGSGASRASSAPYTPSIAVRCQRKAVIATPLAATTVRQARGRASRRAAGARSSSTAPTSQRP